MQELRVESALDNSRDALNASPGDGDESPMPIEEDAEAYGS